MRMTDTLCIQETRQQIFLKSSFDLLRGRRSAHKAYCHRMATHCVTVRGRQPTRGTNGIAEIRHDLLRPIGRIAETLKVFIGPKDFRPVEFIECEVPAITFHTYVATTEPKSSRANPFRQMLRHIPALVVRHALFCTVVPQR